MHIIFLDTETTDLINARLIQLAYKSQKTGMVVNEYFKPPVPISFGAMATHHVTNAMVADKPAFAGSQHFHDLVALLGEAVLVAHNAPFDMQVLKNEGVAVPTHIDTLRVARHLLQSEQYTLQYLRYSLGLQIDNAAAHNALGDVLVLEALYNLLVKSVAEKFGLTDETAVTEKMIALSQTPTLLSAFTFGKYRGKTFAEVCTTDRGYLEWLLGSESQKNVADQNKELLLTLQHHLKTPEQSVNELPF